MTVTSFCPSSAACIGPSHWCSNMYTKWYLEAALDGAQGGAGSMVCCGSSLGVW